MTPDTTPAPMTHEASHAAPWRCAHCGVRWDEGAKESDPCAQRKPSLAEQLEAERTRADEAQTRADALQKALDDYRVGAQRNTARIAELEAGVGRLADVGRQMANVLYNLAQHDGPLSRRHQRIMSDLTREWDQARSLIGHKEGRG